MLSYGYLVYDNEGLHLNHASNDCHTCFLAISGCHIVSPPSHPLLHLLGQQTAAAPALHEPKTLIRRSLAAALQ